MQTLLIFLFVSAISFAGSLQAGVVNVSVVRTVLSKDLKSALWLAVGGCLPEMLYAVLAILGGMTIQENPWLMRGLGFFTIPVFLGLGLYQLLPGKQAGAWQQTDPQAQKAVFWKGLGLALLNPQLLLFWFGVFVYVSQNVFPINTFSKQAAFVCGTAAGAFGLLTLLALATDRYRSRIEKWLGRYSFNKITGWLFIGLACWGVLRLLKY